MNEITHSSSNRPQIPWWYHVAWIMQLGLLFSIAISLWFIWRTLPSAAGTASAEQAVADRAAVQAEAGKSLGDALARNELSADEARSASVQVMSKWMEAMERDPELRRNVAEWLRPSAGTGPAEQARQAAAAQAIKDSLISAAASGTAPGIRDRVVEVIRNLGLEDLNEIKRGFLNALGVLPIDLLKWLASKITADDKVERQIVVSCCSCNGRAKQGDPPPDQQGKDTDEPPNPQQGEGPGALGDTPGQCPLVVRRIFALPSFGPDQPDLPMKLTAAQQKTIDEVVVFTSTVQEPTILVWAWTDSTAWNIEGHNEKLAYRRAELVRDALLAKHVPRSRVLFAPMWTNDPPDGNTAMGIASKKNRTVRIEVQSVTPAAPPR